MATAAAEPPPSVQPEGEVDIDERFEYDAPRFYDFDEGSPAGAQADGWFDTEGPKGLATPTKPAGTSGDQAAPQQAGQTAQGAAAGTADNQSAQQAEVAGKGGKAAAKAGGEWRQALTAITNNKGRQQAAAQQQVAGKPNKRKAAADAGENGPGPSKARPASAAAAAAAKKQQQPSAARSSAAATTATSASQASSPRLHSRQRTRPGENKTSEQLELERVEKEKEEAAKLRRRNAEAVKHVLQPPPPAAVHSNKPLTEPVGVELCTSKRQRMHSMETRSMQPSPFKSMAEQIAVFEGRLPGKHRLGESSSSAAAADAASKQHHGGVAGLTVPMSPQFATKKRVRPPRFKPREVVEAEEMAAMPKFKARPLNKRIMQDSSGHLGLPHVETKAPTVPEPFALKTDQRAAEHAPSSSAAAAAAAAAGGSSVFVFAAQGEAGRVTRSKAKKSTWTGQLTQPEPFQLATDARGALKRSAAADTQHEQQEARPVKRARKAAGPFQLATDARGAEEEARLEGIRRQQEEQARRDAEFKARPLNKAVLAGAWKPAPHSTHELTVPDDVVLRSDKRAAARRQFDAAVAAKQAELEAERNALQELQRQQEEEAVREHRKKLGHKALPLPHH